MRKPITTALAAVGLAVGPISPAASAVTAWVQMVPGGAEARLVTEAPGCPSIIVDGGSRATVERAGPADGFANRVCSAELRPGDRRIVIDGQVLPAPRPRPRRLVILGDSGCRLKGGAVQHCNDPTGWPFATIAALAAARKPDLVIHVGDYYYRETACPAGIAACAGSPFGDTWATWKAELFDPAAPLLAAAPWVFTRGNHEDCKRGGAGWFRQLDAAPAAKACPAESETFAVDLGGFDLFVVDSADTDDFLAPDDKVARFAARLWPVRARADGASAWIVTHRPVWDSSRLGTLVGDGLVNATEREAVKRRGLSDVGLVLSGHVHNFTSAGFGPARPPQLIVGTGGDTLDLGVAAPPASGRAWVDGLPADIFTMGRFGYFVFDRRGEDWDGRFYDARDGIAAICRLHRRALSCRAPGS